MVAVHPIELANVQGQTGVVGHRHKELLDQLGVVAADLLGRDRQAVAQVRPAAAVERHLHQGLIEGRHKVAKAVNAAAIAQGLGQRLAHGDAHVLVGVVVVDVGVTDGADLQIQQAVAGQLVQHVVQKRHTRTHLTLAAAIQVEPDPHIGLAGDAMDLACSHGSDRRTGWDQLTRSCRRRLDPAQPYLR